MIDSKDLWKSNQETSGLALLPRSATWDTTIRGLAYKSILRHMVKPILPDTVRIRAGECYQGRNSTIAKTFDVIHGLGMIPHQ